MATAIKFNSNEMALPNPSLGATGAFANRENGIPIIGHYDISGWANVTTLSGIGPREDIKAACNFYYNLRDITFQGFMGDGPYGGHANVPMLTFGPSAFSSTNTFDDRNQPRERAFQQVARLGNNTYNPITYNGTGISEITAGNPVPSYIVKIRWFPAFSAFYNGSTRSRSNLIGYGLPPLTTDSNPSVTAASSNFSIGHNFFGLGPTTACRINFVGGWKALPSGDTNNVIRTSDMNLGGVRCVAHGHANCNRALVGAEGISSTASFITGDNYVFFEARGRARTFDEDPEYFDTSASNVTFQGLRMHTYD